MGKALARFGVLAGLVLLLLTGTPAPAHAAPGVGPPDPVPAGIALPGVDTKTNQYCSQDDPKYPTKGGARCRPIRAGEIGGTVEQGEGSADKKEARRYELRQLKKWRAKVGPEDSDDYKKLDRYVNACVKKGGKFSVCEAKGRATYPPPVTTPDEWVSGKISEAAADGIDEAAATMGDGVVWILRQFADAYSVTTEIQLSTTGIGPVLSVTTALSAVLGVFVLLLQWGKIAVTQSGESAATAILGLVKYGLGLAVYLVGTQAALNWSHILSTSLINYTFENGGGTGTSADEAMRQQLGELFTGLTGAGGAAAASGALLTGSGAVPGAAGAVILLAIVVLLAIGGLWLELLMRQAGIMILVTVMPLVLAGQMADATSEWWTKARNALIALILLDPVIVIVFSIGFSSMAGGKGIQNVLVGLLIFATAAFAWPVMAKFMVFSSVGEGSGAASGLLSTLGSSASSSFGGFSSLPSGAGTVPGGAGFTQAVEQENSAQAAGGGGGRGFWGRAALGSGSFMSGVTGAVGMGLQVASAGKDALESAAANTAAHGGLGQGSPGGRHVVVNRRGGGGGGGARPAPAPREDAAPPTTTQPVQQSGESEPPSPQEG
jgi:hypothetical protein